MLLLYPALAHPDEVPLGSWRRFDRVTVDELTIEGLELQVRGLAQKGGFEELVRRVRTRVTATLESAPSAADVTAPA